MKKNEKLLDTLGEVDDELIPVDNEKTEKKPEKKKSFIKWIPAVGGVCAAAAIGIFALNNVGIFGSPIDTNPVTTTSVTEDTAPVSPEITTTTQDIAPAPEEDKEIAYQRLQKSTVVSEITANSVSGENVLTDTSFTIKSNADLSAEELSGKLSITPKTDFDIEKSAECEYILTARTAFEKGSVVKLSVESEEGGTAGSWAFQTVDDFRIKSVYPDEGWEYVSTDSGIEITFSESADLEDVKAHFSVKPELNGSFTSHNNTVYFVPEEEMKPDTNYTVSFSEGIKSMSGNELKEGISFSFKTSFDLKFFYTFNGISETFIMGDPVVIEVSGADEVLRSELDLKLYRYNSGDDYISDLKQYSDEGFMEIDESRMTEIFASNEKPLKSANNFVHFVMLPYELEEGYYAASLTQDNTTKYYFIEMNPISVYSACFGEKTLLYINDTNTGKAAAGAEITLHTKEGDFTAKADSKGVAEIVTGDNAYRTDTIEINYGGHRYLDLLQNYAQSDVTYEDLFYTYIYTDREAYQTTDTINVWGVILPRRDGAVIPENLYLSFGEGETGGKQIKITPAADGTFTATIPFADRRSTSWASLYLLDGDNENAVICSKSVSILDYVKPTYTFDVTAPDYVIMPQKDPFDVQIDAHYFDGTPAPDLVFEAYGVEIVSGSSTTDDKGTAAMKVKSEDVDYSWKPVSLWTEFGLTGIENTSQYALKTIPAFYRDVMLQSDCDYEGKTLTVNTNRIDFTKIPEFLSSTDDGVYWYGTDEDYEILKGEVYDTKVTINIERSWNERIETGSYYDFIEKKTVKSYDYEYHREDLGTFTVDTVNGVGVFENLPFNYENSSYYITISYCDSLGQSVSLYESTSSYYNRYYSTDYRDFYLERSQTYFKENDIIEFTLKERYITCNGDPEGKIFFITYQNDILDSNIYDDITFRYKVDNRCVPDFNYCGAYFDGRHVYPIIQDCVVFDTSEREILFEVSSDKDKYDAGEEVTLTVYARDINGNPVSGAPVSLSVVDEAAFAVREQNVDILSDLYPYISYSYAYQKCSYIQHVMNGLPGSEKGGGDPDSSVRKDFRDNPYFGSVTTDKNGKAVFSFKLADTITTWRATIQCVSDINNRLYAGNTKFPIVATRPVFVSPIMLSEYVAGDDIALTAKCVGIGDMDRISVTVSGNGQDKTIDILACETANFGKLPAGEYTVTFRASNGENSDAMELPLKVVETKQEVRVGKDISLQELSGISPTKWPVSLTFYDKEYEFCKEILSTLAFYYGERLDMELACKFAETELGWSENGYEEAVEAATASGYAKLMESSGTDIKLTALLCAAFPESVSREAVITAFEDTLKDCDKEDMAYCYMGLAALGKPVIGDINRLLADEDSGLNRSERLYLTAGLALAGDFTSAYESYTSLTEEIKFYEGKKGAYAYLIDEEYTRLALMTASVLNLPEAEMLARGLVSKEPQYDSYALELVVYIRNYVPKISGSAVFSYNLNGERKTVKLDRYGLYSLSFDKEQFLSADFRVDSGSVSVYAGYVGRISEISEKPTMKVSKTYTVMAGSELKPGGQITVRITAEPYSVIEDIIPSCARFYKAPNSFFECTGQHIRLYTDKSGTARYVINLTTSGDYVTEGAYAYIYDNEGNFVWGMSESGTITVEKVNEGV
ncbi:MAG: Ig-like domain-containing protein [Ruminiclostridium sp.]